jgi:L-threonylcarbamoyladenylate synthase|tara:strand:- start:1331 stop:1903 length:573 start_codon:yes stop_codon:yes gene_type:complete
MVIRINITNKKEISETCAVLEKGGVIVYPTDTLYGFGCDAKNESAIQKINDLKGRLSPMSVLASDKSSALSWMNLDETQKQFCSGKLGGASTIIVPVHDETVSPLITGENNSLGIRIPDHDFCQKLSNAYPNPITTTSVNRTGQPAMTNPEDIMEEFGDEIDLIIDAGIVVGTGSTIYMYDKGELTILRS